jgi:hypothetical protein
MSRKGTNFFAYDTNLTETIRAISVEGSQIWTAGVIYRKRHLLTLFCPHYFLLKLTLIQTKLKEYLVYEFQSKGEKMSETNYYLS